MQNTEKINLPQWFWRLVPVLTARQSPADFETWLLTPATERVFPEPIYQALAWVNYQQPLKSIYLDICTILSEVGGLAEKIPNIHKILSLFICEYVNSDVCLMLPLPDDYCENIFGMLWVLNELEAFGYDERDYAIYHQQMMQYFDELCAYLIGERDLPNLPDFQAA